MLVTMLLASSLLAAPVSTGASGSAANNCPSMDVQMGSHETEPKQAEKPSARQLLPAPKSESRGPAVLLPDCRAEPAKRRKRKSDYPMV